jgi:hypothetical protein
VLTLDLGLPGLDQLEIVWRLKRTIFDGQLIIVSGQPEPVRLKATEIACGNGFKVPAQMVKPVQISQLRDLLAIIRSGILSPAPPLPPEPEQADA